MAWEERALKLLESKLGDRAFTADEAVRLLTKEKGFSTGTTHRLIHDLAETGKLVKLGRGLYRLPREYPISVSDSVGVSASVSVVVVPKVDETARLALVDKGVKFTITGPSLLGSFIHHFPRRMIHLVYVRKGSGDDAIEALKGAGLRCLLRPSRKEVSLALSEFSETDLFVVRESAEVKSTDGVATVERALIDTYFESTRRRIPLAPEEVGRMASNIFATERVNISALLSLAGRRGIRSEIRTVVEELLPDLKLRGAHVRNKHVTSVLSGIAAKER